MIKRFAVLTASVFALALLVQAPAHAQSTDQTDQSEEDWRRSKKKRSTSSNDPTRSLPGLGAGLPIPPLEPIDTLPEESQRHLQRQRAKVIAEMEIGETPGDVPYEPSEAAKTDPELAAEEEEAWEVILTDMQGGSGGGEPADSGPNRVAVAGRGGSSAGSVTRGGSSQSAADILAQLKGLQRGGSRGGGAGQAPQGTSTQAGGAQGAGEASTGQSQTGAPAQQGAQAGQGQAGGGTDGGQQPAGQDQDGQGQAGQGQDGQGDAGQGQAGEGQDGQGQDGGADGAEGDGAQSGEQGDAGADGGAASPSAEPISPLERARAPGPLAPSSGAKSSASDFLKDRNATTPPAEQD